MFGMFKKKEPPRELTPEEQAAKEAYDRVWHPGTDAYNTVGGKLGYYSSDLDKTFRTFSPELSAKIDAIPEALSAVEIRGLYNECSEHYNALQRRYNKLQDEYAALCKENGRLEGKLSQYER